MKKNKRVGSLITELLSHPSKLYSYNDFCSKFDIAKSSLSEDITTTGEIIAEEGIGRLETIQGANGGLRYVPALSSDKLKNLQKTLANKLSDPARILGGSFLYTSDLMFDSQLTRSMGTYFAGKFANLNADYIVTVETKGISLAADVAFMMNLPLVVVRREAKYSEGSTVSINYFSGSYDRIQKMSISKRAVTTSKRAIIIDDFMRGGGSLKGVSEILSEFDIEVVGAGVAIASREPVKKKISNYLPVIYLDSIDEDANVIKTSFE
ncbi:pur operon repressor [Mogibacterium pumilum]|uniref:Pur operon repressor n=1 Tax=Mogibacterium pumilum TaxID=86332 RepID=A0A223ASD7_9FIRM|nr:pur operon repressor [Mogibacterium pumilum]ASS37883.1 pur operon repressor [Mogibacterium pumilum]